MRACVHMLFYVVINLFVAIIVICLSTFFFMCIVLSYVKLSYGSYVSFEFYSVTCYSDGMFQSKFPFKDNKVLSYLSYFI